ncbi:MAG: hypothetical protein HDR75_08735 [Bacteroides sp.]|nr:hypothetical protein [Bacteroides sp.]
MKKGLILMSLALIGQAAMADDLWVAKTQRGYGWAGNGWELEEVYTQSYTREGLVSLQTVTDIEGGVSRQSFRYNSNGKMIYRLTSAAQSVSGPFKDTQKLTRTYDHILTGFITDNDQQVLVGSTWQPSNSYRQQITRNESGDVVQMVRSVFFQGIYDPTHHFNVIYNESGDATDLITEDLDYNYSKQEYYWKPGPSYRNIVWDKFNGQIVSVDNLFDGECRIKSAVATIAGEEYRISADYADDGSWTSRSVQFDPDVDLDLEERTEYTPLDSNGSCTIVTTMGYVEDGEMIGAERHIYNFKYDANGLILLEEELYDNGGEVEIISRTVGSVEYDAENGYPTRWTVTIYDDETGEMVNAFRAEYEDYVNLGESSIDEVAAGEQGARYYDFRGIPVNTPRKGQILIHSNKKIRI